MLTLNLWNDSGDVERRMQVAVEAIHLLAPHVVARKRPHEDGFTWSAKNGYVPRYIERDRRIDYVLIGPQRRDGVGHIIDARVVLDVPSDDGAFASDHFGLLAEIAVMPPGI